MWGGWKWKVRLGGWIDEGKFVGFVCVLVCVCAGNAIVVCALSVV